MAGRQRAEWREEQGTAGHSQLGQAVQAGEGPVGVFYCARDVIVIQLPAGREERHDSAAAHRLWIRSWKLQDGDGSGQRRPHPRTRTQASRHSALSTPIYQAQEKAGAPTAHEHPSTPRVPSGAGWSLAFPLEASVDTAE